MQFFSALSSNELRALYILLPPAHLYTQTPPQRSIQPTGDLCVLPGSHLTSFYILFALPIQPDTVQNYSSKSV